jgi:hypothetical protein
VRLISPVPTMHWQQFDIDSTIVLPNSLKPSSKVCDLTCRVIGGAGYGGLRRLFQKPPPALADAHVPVSGGSLQAFRDNQLSV